MPSNIVLFVAVALTLASHWLFCEALSKGQIQDIEVMVEHIRQCREIPGLSLAVVHQGQTIITKGFGQADVEKDIPATENTRFCIGSLTKAFTATILAELLDTTDKE